MKQLITCRHCGWLQEAEWDLFGETHCILCRQLLQEEDYEEEDDEDISDGIE
jgi:sarcosine oxidase delta subunit